MREIKFRAWGKVNGEMIPWNRLLNGHNLRNVFMRPEMCGLILMQYTGLKDKNGVEIYEGDIIKTHFYSNPYVDEYGGFHEPIDSVVTAVVKNEGVCIPVLLADYQSVEVIGNIYQNKDLLEG